MELVVTQLQQEVITLNAQVADQTGLVEAVGANNNLATAQVRKGTPSLLNVKGLGRPLAKRKIFSSVRRRREAFFAGVIMEFEMMQEWSAEQVTKITHEFINLEFLPTATNHEQGVQNLEFVLQQMQTALTALTSYEANDIVANSRKNLLEAWRRLQKRYDPTTGGRKRNLLRMIISPGRCFLLELQAGIERWESYVSRCEEKLKDKMDDEIKLAGLEALVLEELEKHLILNSNRLRTFEDARLEIVTYVEAKFGVRIRDSTPSDTGSRGYSDHMDVGAVNSLSSGKGKGSSSPRDGCFLSAVEHIFNETAMQARTLASNRLAKANRASHGPRVKAKERVKRKRENPKDSPKDPKVPKAHTRAKHRQLVSQVLKTRNQRQARKLRNLYRHVPLTLPGTMVGLVTNGTTAGVLMNGMMTGVLLDGMKVGNKHVTHLQARFSLGRLDLGAKSSQKRFGWVKMNLDIGVAVNTFPLNFGPDEAGDGRFYRTASGEWIPDGGAWQFQGYDENGLLRSLNRRLTDVDKVLCSAAEIACKGQQDFYLGHDGVYMIPIHSKIGPGMRINFEKLVNGYEKNDLTPVYLENNTFST